ncbi:hypothetical protein ACFWU3_10010 [Streptomyces sp. NPDC058685]|uniref:hypothetical protein n=1 Tax=Streptomyces sp. NPDC058685 TaxID=3346598 RepID=UPI00365FBFAF
MNQPAPYTVALRALARRAAPIALVALLALLGMSLGPGAQTVAAGELRPPASAPADPTNPGQPEEGDTGSSAPNRARASLRPPGDDAGAGHGGRAVRCPQRFPDGPPCVPPAVRCVVLRC